MLRCPLCGGQKNQWFPLLTFPENPLSLRKPTGTSRLSDP
ncbi:hypothetical protein PLANTIT3_100005 [Plantibacter sp. T3]|nr:hypothetical protein PLANTIT3_100005 [Plantibacter sp. T3]